MTCERGDGGTRYVLSDTRHLRANKRKKREQITVFDEKRTDQKIGNTKRWQKGMAALKKLKNRDSDMKAKVESEPF